MQLNISRSKGGKALQKVKTSGQHVICHIFWKNLTSAYNKNNLRNISD